MISLIFSDLHTHNYRQFDTGGSRLKHCLDALERVWKVAHENGIKYVIFGGDLYDQQRNIPTVVVNAIVDKILYLKENYPGVICFSISGNHDQASKNLYGNNAETALKHVEQVSGGMFNLLDNKSMTFPDEKVCLHGIPYYEYPEHFKKSLGHANGWAVDAPKGYKNILIIHQTPSGLGNPNIAVDTNVNDPLYDIFDYVLCGHIHQHQQLSDKFVVIGSPLHRDLGDEGDEKGFMAMDLSNPNKGFRRFTNQGRYPEFKRVKAELGQEVNDDSDNYVVIEPVPSTDLKEGEANPESFSTSLNDAELVKNYWEAVDGEDKKLLETGLKFLK